LGNKYRTAQEISLADLFSLAEAWWMLLYFSSLLRFTSYEPLTSCPNPAFSTSLDHSSYAQKLFRLVTWASRLHIFQITCLSQSLTLRRMLSRKGIASELRIGTLKTNAGYHAHAWLEVNGRVIGNENPAQKGFKTFLPPC